MKRQTKLSKLIEQFALNSAKYPKSNYFGKVFEELLQKKSAKFKTQQAFLDAAKLPRQTIWRDRKGTTPPPEDRQIIIAEVLKVNRHFMMEQTIKRANQAVYKKKQLDALTRHAAPKKKKPK